MQPKKSDFWLKFSSIAAGIGSLVAVCFLFIQAQNIDEKNTENKIRLETRINTNESDIKFLKEEVKYFINENKSDHVEIKSDMKEIQKDIKQLLKR